MAFKLPGSVEQNIDRFSGREWLLPELADWFEKGRERILMLRGDPGTGKSMVAAWLAGAGPAPAGAEAGARLDLIRSHVKGAHFCVASGGSADPEDLARNLAGQLTDRVDGFGDALAATLAGQVTITATQEVGAVAEGASVTGVRIGRLDLGGLGEERSFNRALRRPLETLYEKGNPGRILLVVDALDEALTYSGAVTIVHLLAKLGDLPEEVRFVVTSRPDERVSYLLTGARVLDLIDDAPPGEDDVRRYADERLGAMGLGLEEGTRAALAERIGAAAGGIFLYAHLLLGDLARGTVQAADLAAAALPEGLSGLYHEFLTRELGADRDRWRDEFRPVLGLVAVAQGEGLTAAQLERLVGRPVDGALEAAGQYLDGELPGGPFRPFHRSLADFLLADGANRAYRVDAGRMHRTVADHYLGLGKVEAPWKKWDGYGLRYAVTHLAGAVRGSEQPERHEYAARLVDLALDEDFQQAHKKKIKDLAALRRDLAQTLEAAAADDDPEALPLVVRAALAVVEFRREELRPDPLFHLARRGQVEAAVRHLDLFDVEDEWRAAALLSIAWLAADRNVTAASQLRDRVVADFGSLNDPLAALLGRVDETWGGIPLLREPLPPPPAKEVARELVRRTGGSGVDVELLYAFDHPVILATADEMVADGGYLAEYDGPYLVAYALANPGPEGEQYLRQYLDILRGYGYVRYRRRSLWMLLDAVLRHPDPRWVRDLVADLAAAALEGRGVEFEESLPLAVAALWVQAGDDGARQRLDAYRDWALHEANRLRQERGKADSWGVHKRRLSALAQTYALVLDDWHVASELLGLALDLPYGFAGFQAPACLTLAEGIHVCLSGDEAGLGRALDQALQAAHNVQEATLCAQTTARVNAMRERWWPDGGFDPAVEMGAFRQDPLAAQFCALHLVGESYPHRTGAESLVLPDSMRMANTLPALAKVYQIPPEDLGRVNGETGLEVGDEVNVPDPEFAPLLAARLAAEILVDPELDEEERVGLIRPLVPIAAAKPTALDTVLSRLLLAALPEEAEVLAALAAAAPLPRGEQAGEAEPRNAAVYVSQTLGTVDGGMVPLPPDAD